MTPRDASEEAREIVLFCGHVGTGVMPDTGEKVKTSMVACESCIAAALTKAREDKDREWSKVVADANNCQDPLDPCRGCIKCLTGMWHNEVDRRERGDQERDDLKETLAGALEEHTAMTNERDDLKKRVEWLETQFSDARLHMEGDGHRIETLQSQLQSVTEAMNSCQHTLSSMISTTCNACLKAALARLAPEGTR